MLDWIRQKQILLYWLSFGFGAAGCMILSRQPGTAIVVSAAAIFAALVARVVIELLRKRCPEEIRSIVWEKLSVEGFSQLSGLSRSVFILQMIAVLFISFAFGWLMTSMIFYFFKGYV